MTTSLTEHPDAPDIESSTQDYANRFSGAVGNWFLQIQDEATTSLLKTTIGTSNLKVLDVGGGHGQNINILRSLGASITVVGSTDTCADLLQSSIVSKAVTFVSAPLKELPFEDNSFDVVISYRMLAHIDDWPILVKELMRVSRSAVLVDYASKRSMNALAEHFFAMKKSLESNTRLFRLHSRKQVDKTFREYGAKSSYSYPQFFFPMALHRGMHSAPLSRALEFLARITGLRYLFGSPVISIFLKQ